MARPPMSKFFSTISTEAPFSRAAMAATSPPAPAPITTTSTSWSQLMVSAAAGCAATIAAAPAATPEVKKPRRSIAALEQSSGSCVRVMTLVRSEVLVREVRCVRRLDHHERVAGGRMAGVAAGRDLSVGLVELAHVAGFDREVDDLKRLIQRSFEQ